MAHRVYCPLPKFRDAWVELPNEWLGAHAQRREQAIEAAQKYKSDLLTRFAVALALAENWSVPGLSGPPDKWDFTQLNLQLIAWFNQEVLTSYGACFIVPKGLSEPLPVNGSTPTETTTTDGSLTPTES